MDTRKAMKAVLRLMFDNSDMLNFSGDVDNAIEIMADDDTFFSEFQHFFDDHVSDFGENYNLSFD